jgi:hypothetical protein
MIQNEYPGFRPGMQIARDLELLSAVEQAIERNHLAVVIEGRDSFELTRSNIDDTCT